MDYNNWTPSDYRVKDNITGIFKDDIIKKALLLTLITEGKLDKGLLDLAVLKEFNK